ncbi:cupin domain-containing protein [Bailinhaonella thermotolerans]|uniref:Cupin domain-containing protein n=1 Tax=Bailinhaonella thermotolerans TaxID=1070861 RepID=A0A3A4B3L8_9ACTN|nr:cupin domain-containing protein [Bailinhaonella thermotolerans]RJL32775.1 cupin domain-containing protein [Bailinhaonella thermotolerans]
MGDTRDGGEVKIVRSAPMYEGKQDLKFFSGIAAETVGSRGICMHLLTIPAGAAGRAHKHEHHESAIYMLKGRVGVWYGEGLRGYQEVGPGEFVYVPADVPHLPVNLSETEPAEAVIARTDPSEQESTVLLPDLEDRVAALRRPAP